MAAPTSVGKTTEPVPGTQEVSQAVPQPEIKSQVRVGTIPDELPEGVEPRYLNVEDIPVIEFDGAPALDNTNYKNIWEVVCIPGAATENGKPACFNYGVGLAEKLGQKNDQAGFVVAPTDELWRDFQIWNENFADTSRGQLNIGRSAEQVTRQYRLYKERPKPACRNEDQLCEPVATYFEVSGYKVYLYESSSVLDNLILGPAIGYKRVPLNFTEDEIMKVVVAAGLTQADYRTGKSPDGKKVLYIAANIDLIDSTIIPGITNSSFFTSDREGKLLKEFWRPLKQSGNS